MNENKHSHLSKLVCTHGRTHAHSSLHSTKTNIQNKYQAVRASKREPATKFSHRYKYFECWTQNRLKNALFDLGKSLSFAVAAPKFMVKNGHYDEIGYVSLRLFRVALWNDRYLRTQTLMMIPALVHSLTQSHEYLFQFQHNRPKERNFVSVSTTYMRSWKVYNFCSGSFGLVSLWTQQWKNVCPDRHCMKIMYIFWM